MCMATNGPGATNLVTGVAHSMMAQSPVLVITGAPMMKDTFRDSTQELDQIAMFAPMVKWSVQVRKPERAFDVIREAYHVATSGVPGSRARRPAARRIEREGRLSRKERLGAYEPGAARPRPRGRRAGGGAAQIRPSGPCSSAAAACSGTRRARNSLRWPKRSTRPS